MRKALYLVLVSLLILSLVLTGCEKSDEKQVVDTIEQYVKYMNAEDAPAVYMLAHREVRSIGYKNQLQTMFALYDYTTTLEDVEFVKVEDGVAYADFIMTMIKTDDSDFQDVRINGTFELKQENDEWKILRMDYDVDKDVEYLNP